MDEVIKDKLNGDKPRFISFNQMKNVPVAVDPKIKNEGNIAIYYAEGTIVDSSSNSFNSEIVANKVIKDLKKLQENEDIKAVVVAETALLLHPFVESFVIHDVVAADEACQIEGLGGGVQGHGALPGVIGHGLQGDVPVTTEGQVRPDLVGDHRYIQPPGHVHELLQLLLLPYTARGVVGGAEHHRTDVVALDLGLHVEEVHALHTVAVRFQGAGDDVIAAVFDGTGEADVGGGVDQHVVASGAHSGQGTHEPAQYAVFVADVLLLQPGDAIAALLPADDGVKVLIAGHKVAELNVTKR